MEQYANLRSGFQPVNNRVVNASKITPCLKAHFPIEFIGGSRNGEIIEATDAPDHYEVLVGGGLKEIYERQNSEPPFVYVQIGYAKNETWK